MYLWRPFWGKFIFNNLSLIPEYISTYYKVYIYTQVVTANNSMKEYCSKSQPSHTFK